MDHEGTKKVAMGQTCVIVDCIAEPCKFTGALYLPHMIPFLKMGMLVIDVACDGNSHGLWNRRLTANWFPEHDPDGEYFVVIEGVEVSGRKTGSELLIQSKDPDEVGRCVNEWVKEINGPSDERWAKWNEKYRTQDKEAG